MVQEDVNASALAAAVPAADGAQKAGAVPGEEPQEAVALAAESGGPAEAAVPAPAAEPAADGAGVPGAAEVVQTEPAVEGAPVETAPAPVVDAAVNGGSVEPVTMEAETTEAVVAPEAVAPGTAAAGEEAPAQAAATSLPGEGAASAAAAGVATGDAAAGAAEVDDPTKLPPHSTEVFVGGVPRTAEPDHLRAFAAAAGEVHTVTLLKDPANPELNRGFGFVAYADQASAKKALETLGGKELPEFPGQLLRVAPSQSKHKLYVANLPKEMTKDEFEESVKPVVKGLEQVELLMSREVASLNRGFGFLEFYNHACAVQAKAALGAQTFKLRGRQLTVLYAEPRVADQQAQAQAQAQAQQQIQQLAVYVGNLPASADENSIKELFGQFGEVSKVVIPALKPGRTHREYGFVHFTARDVVVKLLSDAEAGTKPSLDGNTLEVKPAKQQTPSYSQQGYGYGGRGAGGYGGYGQAAYGYDATGYDASGYGYDASAYGYDPSGYAAAGYDQYGGYGGGYGYDASGYGGQVGTQQMVPMMLPSGQVGYVLQGQGAGGYGPARGGRRGGGYAGVARGGARGAYGARGGRGGGRYPY